jgi:hypothetical protein
MKNNNFILTLVLILFSTSLYCAQADLGLQEVDLDTKLQLGFQTGFGLGFQSGGGENTDRKIVPKLSYDMSFALHYYFMRNVGFAFELGYQQFQIKEKSESLSYYSSRKIKYLFFSFSPIFKIDKVIFSFGVYFGLVSAASVTTTYNTYNNTEQIKNPDLGLTVKAGYCFKLDDKLDLITSLSLKYQLLPYGNDETVSGKVLVVFLSLSLMFDI